MERASDYLGWLIAWSTKKRPGTEWLIEEAMEGGFSRRDVEREINNPETVDNVIFWLEVNSAHAIGDTLEDIWGSHPVTVLTWGGNLDDLLTHRLKGVREFAIRHLSRLHRMSHPTPVHPSYADL